MRPWRLALALLGLLPAVGRAAPVLLEDTGSGPVSLHVKSLAELRFQRTIRQRYDFSCGSAALATLLTFQYGVPVTEDEVFSEMLAHGDGDKIRREGFSLLDLQGYLRAHGFRADGFQVPIARLEEARLPAIVLVRENGFNHFVVIKGASGDRILLGDPSMGTRTIRRGVFEELWRSRIVFVIRDHTQAARFNAPEDWALAPRSPLAEGVNWYGLGPGRFLRLGPGEF